MLKSKFWSVVSQADGVLPLRQAKRLSNKKVFFCVQPNGNVGLPSAFIQKAIVHGKLGYAHNTPRSGFYLARFFWYKKIALTAL